LPIQKSDHVILGANNYPKGVFNGEFAVINEVSEQVIQRTISLRGQDPVTLTWREVELVFPDADSNSKVVKGMMLENFLYGANFLKPEEMQALYVDFTIRHKELRPKTKEFSEALMQDEYFNCLQMKYGYAVTCHKAQGGEWDNVFTVWDNDILEGFNCYSDTQRRAGKTNQDFYRWAYTAITRASKKLYALNPPFFNSYSHMTFLDATVSSALNDLKGIEVKAEEIQLDNEWIQKLEAFNLLEQPISIQDHFINSSLELEKKDAEIIAWQKLGYEIRYTVKRDQEKAVFKTYINAKNEFKNSFSSIPNLSTPSNFNTDLTDLFNNLPTRPIKRNTTADILSKIEFDVEFEEKYPFTIDLFDDLEFVLKESAITIFAIQHLHYKERYTFKRNQDAAVLDFEYNKDGFFGRIVPIQNKTTNQSLLASIQTAVKKLKEEYAS
jgi:hypothetical protein